MRSPVPVRRALTLAAAMIVSVLIAAGGAEAACSTDQGGKYANLQAKLLLPEDEASFGDCSDYGYWKGGVYKGHAGLPPGYWVYAAPYWYLWAEIAASRDKAEAERCSPHQGFKYTGLLHQLYLPDEDGSYGRCHDFGWWSNSSYRGYNGLTPGYWVYAYPDWYVWRKQN